MTRPTTTAISPFFIVSNVDRTIAFGSVWRAIRRPGVTGARDDLDPAARKFCVLLESAHFLSEEYTHEDSRGNCFGSLVIGRADVRG
jgi:hypothetical protein